MGSVSKVAVRKSVMMKPANGGNVDEPELGTGASNQTQPTSFTSLHKPRLHVTAAENLSLSSVAPKSKSDKNMVQHHLLKDSQIGKSTV